MDKIINMKQETLQLTGGAGKEKRRELDFYPTPKNVTIALMKFLKENDILSSDQKVWEPACGDGSMSKVIESYGNIVISSDIRDTGYGNPFVNFITNTGTKNVDAIITNPPFNLSQDFIRISLQKSILVCMLLKSQYWHAKIRADLFFENPPAYILPLTWRPDFLEHERKEGDKKGAPTMEVIWTVWLRGRKQTLYQPLLKPL